LFDYYSIPELKSSVDSTKEMEKSEDPKIRQRATILKLPVDKIVELKVKVRDSYLAREVISSMYSDDRFGIPGMELLEVCLESKTQEDCVVQLRNLADKIERGEITL
jgi:hypothetical protein